MGFYLERDEPAGPGVERLVRERVDAAVAALREPGEDAGAAIHCARKQIKKLRAILRLVRDGIGDRRYRRENGALRDLGQSLGAARDADVMVQTFESLAKRSQAGGRGVAVIRQRLERQRDAAQPKAGGVRQRRQLQRVVRGLEAFAGRVERWPADAVTRGVLHRGLKRIYRQGRDTMREAYAAGEPDAERFHDWRKRVKDLWYLARVLGDARPRKHKRLVADLKKLADLLGEHHDLAVLRERLGSPPKGAGAAVTRVTEAADARQAKVVRAAKPIGARVYREKPGRFTDRLVPSA